jgi:hypothetical protein
MYQGMVENSHLLKQKLTVVLEEFELLVYPFPNLKLGWYIPQTLVLLPPPPLAIILEEHILCRKINL